MELEGYLEDLHYLNKKEGRRSVVNFDDISDEKEDIANKSLEEFISVVEIIRLVKSQFERTKTIIAKLHDDCNNVARINGDIMEQIHQCDAKIRENLLNRKKSKIPAHRSQEVFEQLIRDIHDLNAQYSREMNRDSETKVPCLRLIRHCDHWIQHRISVLTTGLKSGQLRFNSIQPKEVKTNIKPLTEELGENKTESSEQDQLLDSLKQLEQNIQKYISLEIHTSDDFRRVLRIRHLQRVSESIPSGSMRDVETILVHAETPENKDSIQGACALLNHIANEYDECVGALQRFHPNTTNISDQPEPSRRKAGKTKKTRTKGGGSSLGNNKSHVSSTSTHGQPNYVLLQMVTNLITAHQTLVEEFGSVKMRYQADVDRRKRDGESVLKKEMIQNEVLRVQIQELSAEKDKFKRLYDAAKVSFLNKPHKAIPQIKQQTTSEDN